MSILVGKTSPWMVYKTDCNHCMHFHYDLLMVLVGSVKEGLKKKIVENSTQGSLRIKKCLKKWKKSKIFLPPPLPQDVLDFFEFGKNSKFDDPPPCT